MKNLSRAKRRADIERLKKNRKHYYRYGHAYGCEGNSVMSPKQLGKVVQYPAECSCPMCGNGRRHFGEITCKEKLHRIDEKFYIKELSDDMM